MIDIQKINQIEKNRREIRKQTYTKIYEQFSRKIMHAVRTSQQQVFLTVPSFVIGFPVFDRDKAAIYLKRQLQRNGMQVVQVSDYEFHISWKPKKKKKAKPKEKEVQEIDDDDNFPSLINLKKAAAKYK